jgi:asparagine synthase (glutamine-hydrolysing)
MCGIAGAVSFDGRRVEQVTLDQMCEAIHHRGPDDRGTLILTSGRDERVSVGLGNLRLAIIDLAGGHQPIANEDETVWTVLNGELYNYQRLKRELETRGHRFRTSSDTEVIVHLYEEKGERFVEDLEGMFAIAVWDVRRERLVLARDRFGKKPLLYADDGRTLRFGSEFTALLADGSIPRDMDFEALDAYLAFMSVPAPLTIYKAIRKLPPASVLVRDAKGARIESYWSLAYTPKQAVDEREAAERVRDLLTEAVRKRLISEVPLGAFLSGGVDSSAVVAIMAGLTDRPVKTFSIGFEEADYNELPHARRVANRYACEHHEFIVQPRALDVLPTLVRHYGEPYADSSAIPSFYLARLTREHVTVALNGDGGDEAFAGYGWHFANRLAESWRIVPAPFRAAGEALLRRAIPSSGSRRSLRSRAQRFLAAVGEDRSRRYGRWIGVFTGDLKRDLVLGDWRTDSTERRLTDWFARHSDLDAVDVFLAADTDWYLPTDLLVKMDIATMANSLEARSPFLDHRLVEYVATLPSRMKLAGRESKYLLKRAVADLVPAENLSRSKKGFAVPIGQWFRGELREYLADHVLGRRAMERGLFHRATIEHLIDEHQAGRADHAHPLWVLLMLELWHREFIDEAPAAMKSRGLNIHERASA